MIDNRISENVSDIAVSAIKEVVARSAGVEGDASLAWGLPSFRTPEVIRREVEKQMEADTEIGRYTLPDGLPDFRTLVAERYTAATGVEADANRHVMITAGNMQGLNAQFHVLHDPGNEVIVTDPGFPSHLQQIHLCGGTLVFWT